MTKDEILKELIKRRVITRVGENYSFINPKKLVCNCKNLPDRYLGISGTQALKLFFIDAAIPSFSGGSINYALRTTTTKSIETFIKILGDPSIDFSILVDRTKKYYKDKSTVKPAMSKYFMEGLWETVYNDYEKRSDESQSNTFFL